MEETPPSIGTAELPHSPMSLGSRLLNIFISPGDVFEGLKSSPPKHVNWMVPLAIAIATAIVYSLVVFSQPEVFQKIKEKAREAQSKNFQQAVSSGKMTQQQADTALEKIEEFLTPTFYKIMGVAGSVIANVAMVFFVALILWLLARFAFHVRTDYLRTVEISGLALMINALGAILAMQLAAIYGDILRTPSPALLISHLDPKNKVHLILTSLNVTTIWYVAVLSIGLAKITGVRFIKPALWLFGIWAFLTFGSVLAFGGK